MAFLRSAWRHGTVDARVFATATLVAVAHALDDAFVGRQPGVGLERHAVAGLLALAIGVAAVLAFTRVRPGARAALALALGLPALVNGALHIAHVAMGGPGRGDVTGAAAAAAGVVLLALGASIPWRHRRERSATPRECWAARAVAVPVAAVLAVLIAMPVALAIWETHKPRESVGAPPSAAYATVSFAASDGVHLSGWYRPSRNGAAVLVVHGGGGDRTGAVRHARMLERHGYGVLLYDARGRGESDGTPNSYGWDWEKDAFGALDFLARRPDVQPGHIGALGLSSGADTVLELGARRRDVRAIISDGAAARTFADARRVLGTGADTPSAWIMFQAIRVLSGQRPSRTLMDLVPRITAPTLLISGGTSIERDFNVAYARAAPAHLTHWNLPQAGHTAALREFPEAYERRVAAFLDDALLDPRSATQSPERH